MLQLTTRAMTHLKSSASQLKLKEKEYFRLGVTTKGIKLTVDQIRNDDAIIRHGNEVLLVLDPESNDCYEGLIMDFDEKSQRLTFNT